MAPVFLSGWALGLVLQAAVTGTVRDEHTGLPVAGAVVSLPDLGRATATDLEGRYLLPEVPPGPQHITVRFLGYAPRTLHALVPSSGTLEVNVSLRPQPIPLPALQVRPPPVVAVRGTEEGDSIGYPERALSLEAVRQHPLLAEPDVLQALAGGDVTLSPESPSGLHVRGGASDQVAYLVDGIPVFSPYHTGGLFSAWNPDALAGLQLSASAPSPADPFTLSGAVAATTRAPGRHHQAQGTLSTTHARVTLDGPVRGGVGYLVSLRSGFPGLLAPSGEPSYLQGETGDRLAKLEAPAFGGRLRLLGYDSEDGITTAAAPKAEEGPGGTTGAAGRNEFEWHSQSLGAEWRRAFTGAAVRVVAWSAGADASSTWAATPAALSLASRRRDEGLLVAVERRAARSATQLGVRAEHSRTAYRVESPAAAPPLVLDTRTPLVAAFLQHARELIRRTDVRLGASLATAGDRFYLDPRVQLRWTPADRLTLSGSFARLHQFAQSLRNAESIVGTVFPTDLYVGAGAPGVPVARTAQGAIGADYRPMAGVRLGLQLYQRSLDGLVLVAPSGGDPFATGTLIQGSAAARGLALEGAAATARVGVVASYAVQRVRYAYGDSTYVPEHAATHRLEGGIIVFPRATTAIRLGVTGVLGRRTTAIEGGFEWEACNLADRGCEFGGSPRYSSMPLGGVSLPPYLRLDLGLRQHWHLRIGGRDASVALYGTLTNVLGRSNVLTYATDATGARVPVTMRPLAPLVVGLDWRF